jgi:hypothetical protein
MKEETMSAHGTSVDVTDKDLGYLPGFVPSSWDSPYSSLHRAATWIGMGILLSSVAGFGTFVYGFAAGADTTSPMAEHGNVIGTVGIIAAVFLFALGSYLIHVGRTPYHRYQKATGRI